MNFFSYILIGVLFILSAIFLIFNFKLNKILKNKEEIIFSGILLINGLTLMYNSFKMIKNFKVSIADIIKLTFNKKLFEVDFSYFKFWVYILISIVLIIFGIMLICNLKKKAIEKSENTEGKAILFSLLSIILIAIFFIYQINSFNKTVYELEWFTTGHNGLIAKKPIIYIYPESALELTVQLGKKENITCSYPKYEDGWNVTAYPDGTLIEKNTERKLYALYWEGIRDVEIPMNDGFVIKGEDSCKFLEEKLEILGLNEKESEEFIIYWLPKLEANKYNLIRFETMQEIEQNMPLTISQNPDTLIRVWMQFKGLDTNIEIPAQRLERQNRSGFTVVEWGGSEVK